MVGPGHVRRLVLLLESGFSLVCGALPYRVIRLRGLLSTALPCSTDN